VATKENKTKRATVRLELGILMHVKKKQVSKWKDMRWKAEEKGR